MISYKPFGHRFYCMLFFSLGDCLINYLEEYPDANLKQKLYYYFKTSAVDKISRVKYGFIQNYGPGQLIQVIENGAIAGRDIIVSFYLSILAGQVPKMVLGTPICTGALMDFVLAAKLVNYIEFPVPLECILCEKDFRKKYINPLMSCKLVEVQGEGVLPTSPTIKDIIVKRIQDYALAV